MNEETQIPFWVVWCPSQGSPKVRHESEGTALTEAERLAKIHEGDEFIVLEAKHSRSIMAPMRKIKYEVPV